MLYQGDNMMDLKRTNRSAALRLLHEQGAISRKRLAESTGLTPAAITKIVGELIAEGLLMEGRTLPSGGAGRREVLIEPVSNARCALGILINKEQAILSAVWLDGGVIFSELIPLPLNAPAAETLDMLCEKLMKLKTKYRLGGEKVLGIGVAVRGIVSEDGRVLRNSFGALNVSDYRLADEIEQRTGLGVVMENNVRALFSAQMFFSRDMELKSQFFLRCEYGIGASLSINGSIWRGGTQQCAEIGHIPAVRRGGKLCSCGKRGCLETVASPAALCEEALAVFSADETPELFKRMQGREPGSMSIEDVLYAAQHGDKAVSDIVDIAVRALSDALKGVIYVLDPEKIVMYGRLFENSFYLDRLMREMELGVDAGHSVKLEKSKFNLRLESPASPLLVIDRYFDMGGMM